MLGNTWAAYAGPSDQNASHAHVAIQVVLALSTTASIVSPNGNAEVAPGMGFVVRPLVEHQLGRCSSVWLLYVEPASPLAIALLNRIGPSDIARLPADLTELAGHVRAPAEWVALLEQRLLPAVQAIDRRLLTALDVLRADPGSVGIAEAAGQCGLSPSRLRWLAKRQLGIPLATWLLWRKMDRAVRALAGAESIAAAAVTGGFADQAHFTRTMRQMFGVTPGIATPSLRKPGDT